MANYWRIYSEFNMRLVANYSDNLNDRKAIINLSSGQGKCNRWFHCPDKNDSDLPMTVLTKTPGARPAPPGWILRDWPNTFSAHNGPIYARMDPNTTGIGFYSDERHRNLQDCVHGGMLMTLADMSLFDACHRKHGEFPSATVSFNSEFLCPAPIGEFIEASSEVTKSGRTLFFARGKVSCNGKDLLAFSGTLINLSDRI